MRTNWTDFDKKGFKDGVVRSFFEYIRWMGKSFHSHTWPAQPNCPLEGIEDGKSEVSECTTSGAVPTPSAQPAPAVSKSGLANATSKSGPSNATSKASSTSQQPARYKKRVLSDVEDTNFSEEEDDQDMDDIEDNNSSGSSVESDHVPAKRLRTSIATRSSKSTPAPEASTEEADVHQAPSSTTIVHDSRPSNPGAEPAAPTTPSLLHSDLADMEVDEPTASVGVSNATKRKRGVDRVGRPLDKLPVVQSQAPSPSPKPVPDVKSKIPEFLTDKQDVYAYLASIKETDFHNLLKAYITFENTNRVPIRGLLPTYRRPKAIGWWTSRARPLKLPPFDSLKSFKDSVIAWWISLQPDWRKISVEEVTRVEGGGFDDWERLYQPGTNGLLNIVVLAHWWARILEERGTPVDDAYTWFVSDVSWVLSQLTSVVADAHE